MIPVTTVLTKFDHCITVYADTDRNEVVLRTNKGVTYRLDIDQTYDLDEALFQARDILLDAER